MITCKVLFIVTWEMWFDLKYLHFKNNLRNDILSIYVGITLKWMSDDPLDGKSALVEVMAWCR